MVKRKMDDVEVYFGLLNAYAQAKRDFSHALVLESEAKARGGFKRGLKAREVANRAEAKAVRLHLALERCKTLVKAKNPFIDCFKPNTDAGGDFCPVDLTGNVLGFNEVV